jgi:hypothetical protein
VNGHEPDSSENPVSADALEVTTSPEAGLAEALSPAVERFKSCRWRKAAEDGVPEHCTHRDVQPMAGTAGFTADSWCLDCGHYKVRRNPRKRPLPSPEDRYYY